MALGFYSIPESGSPSNRTGQTICEPGRYCVDGVRYLCAAGKYSTDTNRSVPCDTPCEAGTSSWRVCVAVITARRDRCDHNCVDFDDDVKDICVLQGTTVLLAREP